MYKLLIIALVMALVVPISGWSYDLPVTSWGEAFNFTWENIGQKVDCESLGGSYGNITPLTGDWEPNVNGLYGTPIYDSEWNVVGYETQLGCGIETDTGRDTIFKMEFNPNNGFALQQYCNPSYIEDCERIYFRLEGTTFDPICGDTHCSPGETTESCPTDCPNEKTTKAIII